MTKEEKILIERDLRARISYGVKYLINDDGFAMTLHLDEPSLNFVESWNIKPWLRPMESMTMDEKKEFELSPRPDSWLDKNMFDHRGLIVKGLALPVTEKENPYNN